MKISFHEKDSDSLEKSVNLNYSIIIYRVTHTHTGIPSTTVRASIYWEVSPLTSLYYSISKSIKQPPSKVIVAKPGLVIVKTGKNIHQKLKKMLLAKTALSIWTSLSHGKEAMVFKPKFDQSFGWNAEIPR